MMEHLPTSSTLMAAPSAMLPMFQRASIPVGWDVNSPLESLGNCESLTDPAIQLLFEAGCPPEGRLIHSACVIMNQPEAMSSKTRLRLRQHRRWFVPLSYSQQHWALAVPDVDLASSGQWSKRLEIASFSRVGWI